MIKEHIELEIKRINRKLQAFNLATHPEKEDKVSVLCIKRLMLETKLKNWK